MSTRTTAPTGARQPRRARNPNLINAALGAWLVCSTAFWPHSSAEVANALVTGAVILVASLLARKQPKARIGATLAAVWLLLSVWVFAPTSRTSFWNALLVSFAVFFLSLAETEEQAAKGRGTQASR
ncbi:MAG: hypothetical protein FJ096_03480 [Deltaproteobacteria bacterium]|nr:hypothetical protein [Deltaproteobacteria bacterium]